MKSVSFHGISTIVIHLMLKLIYAYIRYMIAEHNLEIIFLNERGHVFFLLFFNSLIDGFTKFLTIYFSISAVFFFFVFLFVLHSHWFTYSFFVYTELENPTVLYQTI